MNNYNEQDLKQVRQEIDAIDMELLHLLNKRSALSLKVGMIKTSGQSAIVNKQEQELLIIDNKREDEILSNLKAHNRGNLLSEHIDNIWQAIFNSSRSLQIKDVKTPGSAL